MRHLIIPLLQRIERCFKKITHAHARLHRRDRLQEGLGRNIMVTQHLFRGITDIERLLEFGLVPFVLDCKIVFKTVCNDLSGPNDPWLHECWGWAFKEAA